MFLWFPRPARKHSVYSTTGFGVHVSCDFQSRGQGNQANNSFPCMMLVLCGFKDQDSTKTMAEPWWSLLRLLLLERLNRIPKLFGNIGLCMDRNRNSWSWSRELHPHEMRRRRVQGPPCTSAASSGPLNAGLNRILQNMISGIPLILALGARMCEPYVYVVFGASIEIDQEHSHQLACQ